MSTRVLCIWLPNWPVQRLQAAEPQLADGALILQTRDSRRGLLVAAANRAARTAGVCLMMRLSEATALIDAVIREHDPHEDIEQLCILAEQVQQFSPIVGIEQLDKQLWAGRSLLQPECILLDVSGLTTYFGGEERLATEVNRWLKKRGLFGYLAIAGSVGAAWAMANYATRKSSQRICNVPLNEDENALQSLPLAALRLEKSTLDILHRLGVYSIANLKQLPRDGLATRLGSQLLSRWDQALGHKAEPIVSLLSQPDWNLQQTLDYPTHDRATVNELLRRLCHELSVRLARRGEGALRIVCRLDFAQSPSMVMQLGLFRPSSDALHLENLLCGQLEQHLFQPPPRRTSQQTAQGKGLKARRPNILQVAPLWRLNMQATLTAPQVWRQAELFEGGEAENRLQLARLIDTLSSRLGRQHVLAATQIREPQPEMAFSFQPLTGRRHDGVPQTTFRKLSSRLAQRRAEPSRDDPLRRPLQLYSAPVGIEVTASSTAEQPSANTCGAPLKIRFRGTWHEIEQACGPERLESGWWRGPSARRDYYRIATRHGSWWWIYRDLSSGKWFLHGAFD